MAAAPDSNVKVSSQSRFRLPRSVIRSLRDVFNRSNKVETERSVVLSGTTVTSDSDGVRGAGGSGVAVGDSGREILLGIDHEVDEAGVKTATYTVAAQANEDHSYTAHTHPIETAKHGGIGNLPNLISNEDMLGVVCDSHLNDGYTSNPNGNNVFDIVMTPMGLFVYYPLQTILDKYVACEDDINVDNAVKFKRKLMGGRFTFDTWAGRWWTENTDITQHIATAYDKKDNEHKHIAMQALVNDVKWNLGRDTPNNWLWAEVENCAQNVRFEEHVGAWHWYNQGLGLFAQVVVPMFGHTLGYRYDTDGDADTDDGGRALKRTKRTKGKGAKATVTVARGKKGLNADVTQLRCTVDDSAKVQRAFFQSETFAAMRWDNDEALSQYAQAMLECGFGIHFIHWGGCVVGSERNACDRGDIDATFIVCNTVMDGEDIAARRARGVDYIADRTA